jgi:hypothetical protein
MIMDKVSYSILYCIPDLQPALEPTLEEFSGVSEFSGRLVELLDDQNCEVLEFWMGKRKAKLMWGGTVELP